MAENLTGASPAPNSPKKDNSRVIIGILGVLLVATLIGVVVLWSQGAEKEDRISAQNKELADTYTKLSNMEDELDQRIVEIERLGGDVSELQQAKAELEAEKEQLVRSRNVAERRLREINDKVQGYSELLKQKDQEITRLKSLSDSLYAENVTLKEKQNALSDTITVLAQNRQKLTEKVEIASRLKAENIEVAAVNRRGKEREGEFRDSQIEQLKVTFNLADNPVAPIESKDILLRIIDPNGNPMFDVTTGSGTMMVDGREEFYTANQEILFDNTRQQVSFLYDKEGEYMDGTYTVELYADDYLIGTKTFLVK